MAHSPTLQLEIPFETPRQEPLTTMPTPIIQRRSGLPTRFLGEPIPYIIEKSGKDGMMRFVEFFTARIRNKNTRTAYAQAVGRLLRWCDQKGLQLEGLNPVSLPPKSRNTPNLLPPSSNTWLL